MHRLPIHIHQRTSCMHSTTKAHHAYTALKPRSQCHVNTHTHTHTHSLTHSLTQTLRACSILQRQWRFARAGHRYALAKAFGHWHRASAIYQQHRQSLLLKRKLKLRVVVTQAVARRHVAVHRLFSRWKNGYWAKRVESQQKKVQSTRRQIMHLEAAWSARYLGQLLAGAVTRQLHQRQHRMFWRWRMQSLEVSSKVKIGLALVMRHRRHTQRRRMLIRGWSALRRGAALEGWRRAVAEGDAESVRANKKFARLTQHHARVRSHTLRVSLGMMFRQRERRDVARGWRRWRHIDHDLASHQQRRTNRRETAVRLLQGLLRMQAVTKLGQSFRIWLAVAEAKHETVHRVELRESRLVSVINLVAKARLSVYWRRWREWSFKSEKSVWWHDVRARHLRHLVSAFGKTETWVQHTDLWRCWHRWCECVWAGRSASQVQSNKMVVNAQSLQHAVRYRNSLLSYKMLCRWVRATYCDKMRRMGVRAAAFQVQGVAARWSARTSVLGLHGLSQEVNKWRRGRFILGPATSRRCGRWVGGLCRRYCAWLVGVVECVRWL